jgi:hypothetical protein
MTHPARQKSEIPKTNFQKDAYQACFELDFWNNRYCNNAGVLLEVLRHWGYKENNIDLEVALKEMKEFREDNYTQCFKKDSMSYFELLNKVIAKLKHKVVTLVNLDEMTEKVYSSFIQSQVDTF